MISKITHKIAGLAGCILLLTACGGGGGGDLPQATVIEPDSGEAAFTQEMKDALQNWDVALKNHIAGLASIVAPTRELVECKRIRDCQSDPVVTTYQTKLEAWHREIAPIGDGKAICKGNRACLSAWKNLCVSHGGDQKRYFESVPWTQSASYVYECKI